jgi:hypothetical protein
VSFAGHSLPRKVSLSRLGKQMAIVDVR